MSTTTATFGHHSTETNAASKAPAVRKSFYDRFIEARLREGRAHAAGVLARMSDAQLMELGFKPEQVREIRTTKAVPVSFWA